MLEAITVTLKMKDLRTQRKRREDGTEGKQSESTLLVTMMQGIEEEKYERKLLTVEYRDREKVLSQEKR